MSEFKVRWSIAPGANDVWHLLCNLSTIHTTSDFQWLKDNAERLYIEHREIIHNDN